MTTEKQGYKCEECGKSFTREPTTHRPEPKFCKQACFLKAYKKKTFVPRYLKKITTNNK